MNKKSVIFSGPNTTLSGYGVHARQVTRWLLSKEKEYNLDLTMDPVPWGMTQWLLHPSMEDGLIGEIQKRSGNRKQKYDVSIQLKLPNEFNPEMGHFNVGMTAGVETDRCNPQWIECINKMNLLIVPSDFIRQTFLNTGGVKVPIFVIPESFPDVLLDEPKQDTIFKTPTKFNFLVFGQITGNNPENDRKNIFYTIKWLCETFAGDQDVGIIVKTNSSRSTKIDKMATTSLITKLAMEVKKNPFPKLYLLHGDLSDQELNALYKQDTTKALVSFHRSEGFGLTLLEAAASGLPVIATDWSASKEFLKEKYVKIAYQLAPIHETRIDNQIFMPGVRWANPSEQDAKIKLKEFRKNPYSLKAQAKSLAQDISENYSSRKINDYYTEALEQLFVDKK